jgi:hypothetical protein
LTVSSLRSRAGFVSHRQRSWDSPFGAFSSRKVSGLLPPGRTHVPFHLAVFPPPKRRAGPIGRGSWVSPLSRVPGRRRGVSSPTAGCSLGFRPSRVLRRKPWPGFRPTSSLALRRPDDESPRPPAPRSIDRFSLGLARAPYLSTGSGQDDPSRVCAPARSAAFGRESFRAICSPHAVTCISAAHPAIFGWIPRSTGVAGIG